MPAERFQPLSHILSRAAATLERPRQVAAATLSSALSFLRGGRDPSINARQAAALASVDTRAWNAQLLKQLEWRRFEELCVAYFETLGYTASIARSATQPGVDIRLTAKGAERPSLIVQCRAWDAYRVGIKAVRELRAAMAAAGLAEGALLSSGRFTPEAASFARQHNVGLIDGAGLLERIAALPPEQSLALLKFATQGDFLTPTCPSCSLKMISRRSTKEGRQYWGCRNYPRCKHMISSAAHALQA
jgi:restriction system protein